MQGLLCTRAVHGAPPGIYTRIKTCVSECCLPTAAERNPLPALGWRGHFLLYLKLTLSFPYAEKREQIWFDVRVSRERVFLSSFCHKKRMEMCSSSQGH